MNRDTLLNRIGRDPLTHGGCVNPPLHQTSTVVFETYAQYCQAEQGSLSELYSEPMDSVSDYSYGLMGTSTTRALARALATLESCNGSVDTAAFVTSSGLSAITVTLLSLTAQNDHVLVADTVYGPTRRFCTKELSGRFGITVEYFDPNNPDSVRSLIRDNTRVVFLENPGSLTMEVQDVPAITAMVKEMNPKIRVVVDNTWATPLYFEPFRHGADVSIQAATKYIAGHSDLLLGAVVAKKELAEREIFPFVRNFGERSNPYECWLALRGLRTLAVRLKQHEASALKVCEWLSEQSPVDRVLYPAFPKDSGHALWKRDFSGATGLLSFALHRKLSKDQMSKFVDGLSFFGIGASWGGFESLVMPCDDWIRHARSVTHWDSAKSLIRLHIGLEDVDDLIADLDKAFHRLATG